MCWQWLKRKLAVLSKEKKLVLLFFLIGLLGSLVMFACLDVFPYSISCSFKDSTALNILAGTFAGILLMSGGFICLYCAGRGSTCRSRGAVTPAVVRRSPGAVPDSEREAQRLLRETGSPQSTEESDESAQKLSETMKRKLRKEMSERKSKTFVSSLTESDLLAAGPSSKDTDDYATSQSDDFRKVKESRGADAEDSEETSTSKDHQSEDQSEEALIKRQVFRIGSTSESDPSSPTSSMFMGQAALNDNKQGDEQEILSDTDPTSSSQLETPSEASDKPSETLDKPSEGSDKPSEGSDKPSETLDKPSEGSDKPSETSDKPSETSDKQ